MNLLEFIFEVKFEDSISKLRETKKNDFRTCFSTFTSTFETFRNLEIDFDTYLNKCV